jgi:hypothetical protein
VGRSAVLEKNQAKTDGVTKKKARYKLHFGFLILILVFD